MTPIKNHDELINKIIQEYNTEIDNIDVYGNEEFPLFVPAQIRDILQIKHSTFDNIMNAIWEHIDFIYLNYMQIYYTKNKINKRSQINKRLLTKYGLHKILVKNNKNIPKEILDLIF